MQRTAATLFACTAAALIAPASAHAVSITTEAPTGVTSSQVTLNGSVFSSLSNAQYRFQVGTTPSYTAATPVRTVGAFLTYSVRETLTGLRPGTTYHYRLIGAGTGLFASTTYGANRSFTTAGSAPVSGGGGSGGGGGSAVTIPGTEVTLPGTSTPLPSTPAGESAPSSGTSSPDKAPTSSAPASVTTTPQLQESVAVARGTGTVTVKSPEGGGYTTLKTGAVIPVGSVVDTRRGTVALTSELPSGKRQTGRFHGAVFLIKQARNGFVDLHLRGSGCTASGRGAKASASARRKPPRRLFGRDKGGRFRTHGRNSHATVRGTRWMVEDRCDGTLTRVTEGAVVVRDFTTKKRVLVKAGERYLARPRR